MSNAKNPTLETEDVGTGNGAPPDNKAGSGNGTPPDKKEKPGDEKKIGLVTFIQSAEPNKYVVSMLKNKKAMEVHTKTEWEQIVDDLLKQKVS
jgi:hypothetical protein